MAIALTFHIPHGTHYIVAKNMKEASDMISKNMPNFQHLCKDFIQDGDGEVSMINSIDERIRKGACFSRAQFLRAMTKKKDE